MTRADFLVGSANEAAIGLIDRFPDWPNPVVVLVGPEGSGKSHLAHIWKHSSGAIEVAARELRPADVDGLTASGPVLVEDLHAGNVDQNALFHLLNRIRERGTRALLTSRVPVDELAFELPDLQSRLRAVLPVELLAPDDNLLAHVIVKLFSDRQLTVDAGVVDFICRRMERSLEAANRLVADLDRLALAEGRPITRLLAAAVLRKDDENEPA